jgi:uncharacterized protein YkvS
MTITQIYQQYSIPLNLQKHMLRVAAVGNIICDNFKKNLNKNLIVKTLLLHDMGNIIKFDFSRSDLLEKIDQNRIEDLKKNQQEFLQKYGKDPDKATLKIIKEITNDKNVVELCQTSHGESLDEFLVDENWPRKIAFYCDMKAGPFGIVNISERFNDLANRNPSHKNLIQKQFEQCKALGLQLQKMSQINLQNIDNKMVGEVIEKLKDAIIS